ncbi:hypothetical protein NC652_021242 [Populus alba x Populus x berolinensis]|nr:hypothetical protein NC652_021242 [Populus alba x Populus x berolinensis]
MFPLRGLTSTPLPPLHLKTSHPLPQLNATISNAITNKFSHLRRGTWNPEASTSTARLQTSIWTTSTRSS